MLIIKYRHRLNGGHVHVRQFVVSDICNLALAGTLRLKPDEWAQWKLWLLHAPEAGIQVIVTPDD